MNQVDQLIVCGEIFLKLKYTVLFIQIFMIVSIIMVTLVCFNLDNSIEMYRMIIAYIIMLPMIMFCMTYKNLMMNHQKRKSLQLIHKMGMTKIHQLTLLKKEWLLFYMMVSLLPGLYIIVIFIKFYICLKTIYKNLQVNQVSHCNTLPFFYRLSVFQHPRE